MSDMLVDSHYKVEKKTMMTNFCRMMTYRVTAILLLLHVTLPAAAYPVTPSLPNVSGEPYAIQQAKPYAVYDVSPPSGVPGRAYPINIISHDPDRTDITEKTAIFAPGGISVSDVRIVTSNGLSAKITIPDDTPLGRVQLLLKDKDGTTGKIIGVAEFDVTSVAQSPIPPGLDPEVDIMWGVMAKDVVRHNFGKKIAKHYYGIQLGIGNNSGFDLQIASVGFRLPLITNIKNIVPTNSYRATRGTLERQQELGGRAFALNSLKTAGILLTSFLPFWHAVGPAANAARFADILNGPVVTGFERIVPDTIISNLTRLDDQTLRDGLIVKNNSQIRTTVFVAKQLLDIARDEGVSDNAPTRYLREENKRNLDYREDPQYVNLRLGEIVLIGQPIKYLNRLQVIKTAEGGPVTPPPIEQILRLLSKEQKGNL